MFNQMWKKLSLQSCRPFSSTAKHFLKPSADGNNVQFFEDAVRDLKGNTSMVTSVIGPSRQGKSHFCNLLVGKPGVFSVSSDPMNAHTLGAWVETRFPKGGLIVDCEGISHKVTDSTKKMFFTLYGTSTTMIYSSKDPGADSFHALLEQLRGNMGGFAVANLSLRPNCILLLRDAESFGFSMKTSSGRYEMTNGQTFQEAVDQKLSLQRDILDGLFKSFRAFAIPNLQSVKQLNGEGDLTLLLDMLETSRGALINLTDCKQMKAFVDNINSNGVLDSEKLISKLLQNWSAAALGDELQEGLANKYNFNELAMLSAYCKDLKQITDCFPQAASASCVVELEEKILGLACRMRRFEMEYPNAYVGFAGDVLIGAAAGAVIGAGSLGLAASRVAVVRNIVQGTTSTVALGGTTGGILGAIAGAPKGVKKLGPQPSDGEISEMRKEISKMRKKNN